MPYIFISYSKEDKSRAEVIAKAIEKKNYSVWWDRKIPPGKTFDEVIEDAIAKAACVVVLWSKTSVISNWVKEEAEIANKRGILVPAMIDHPIKIPLGFGRIQAANLTDGLSEINNPGFSALLNEIKIKLENFPNESSKNQADIGPSFPVKLDLLVKEEAVTPNLMQPISLERETLFKSKAKFPINRILLVFSLVLSILTSMAIFKYDLFWRFWIYDPYLVYYTIGTSAFLLLFWSVLKFADIGNQVELIKFVFILFGFLATVAVTWRGIIDLIYVWNDNCVCDTPQCQPPFLYTSHNFLPYVALVIIALSTFICLITAYTRDDSAGENRIKMYKYLGIFCGYLIICRLFWEIADQLTKKFKQCF